MAGGLDQISEEYVSPQIGSVLGFRPEEWIADPHLWIDRLHPDDRDEVLDETTRSVDAGEPFKLEYRMIARSGRIVWLHDVASVVSRDPSGRATRYQGVQLDITARKVAERAERRSREERGALNRDRRELLERLVRTQDEERQRISEGIHDDTMQSLFSVATSLDAIARRHPELEALPDLRAEISGLIERLRRLAFDLHPRILDTEGLRSAFRSLVDRSASGSEAIDHRFDDRLKEEPSTGIALTLYRIAQEALSNAHRHGDVSTIIVTLEDRAQGVLLRIEDDGHGFDVASTDPAHEHLGLRTMRERAEIAGGWLQIDSTGGVGTTVECWLPTAVVPTTRASQQVPRIPEDEDDIGSSEIDGVMSLLSQREQEVARLLALGHTNAEIGAILHLSTRTIEHHRSRVFRKLGVRSRAGLVQALRAEPPSDEHG